jgi:hypothetical protein
VVIFAANIRR